MGRVQWQYSFINVDTVLLRLAMGIERPAEFQMDEKIDRCVDITLRRFVYGTVGGMVAAALLCRGASSRSAAVAFGAGAGLGSAYTDCAKDLEKMFPMSVLPSSLVGKK